MKMTRQHFKLIAQVIAALPPDNRRIVANFFAEELAKTNSNFNKLRFIEACNLEAML